MGSVPLALSVHQFVSSVGADAGFASIIGLAILVLLYFAQARETANLRDQAAEAGQRVEQLEARLAELTRRPAAQAAPPPAAMPAPARAQTKSVPRGGTPAPPARVPVGAGALAPGAPAGVAAPALTAATRLIPVAVPDDGGTVRLDQGGMVPPNREGVVPPDQGGTVPPDEGAVVSMPNDVPADTTIVESPAPAVGSPAPATAAGANGATRQYAAPPPVGARPVSGRAQTRGGPVPSSQPVGAPVEASVPGRAAGSSRAAAPGRAAGPGRGPAHARPAERRSAPTDGSRGAFLSPTPVSQQRSRTRRVLATALGVLLVAAVVVVLLVVSSNGGTHSATNASHTTNAPAKRGAAFLPARVTVAVLNGTATPGLAGRTSRRLAAVGYKPGAVATATDQTEKSTVVGYLPGHRSDALRVAASLKLPGSAVQSVGQGAQAVACPPPAACTANVVVTVGADLASS